MPPFFRHRPCSRGHTGRVLLILCAFAMALCIVAFWPHETVFAWASASHRQSVAAFTRAENIQHLLDSKPMSRRTRGDYERALDAYRAIYHSDPSSPEAGPAIAAVANLLASEGRCFRDAKLLRDAVAQWEFLRRQYPGSPLRQRALLRETEIEQHDLHDRAMAKNLCRRFLKQYPHSELADEARAGLHGGTFMETAGTRSQAVHATTANVSRTAAAKSSFLNSESAQPTELNKVASAPDPSSPTNNAVGAVAESLPQAPATIKDVRYWAEGNSTRIAVDISAAVPCRVYSSPDGRRTTLVFFGAQPAKPLDNQAVARDENLRSLHLSALTANQTALVLESGRATSVSSFHLSNPARWIVDLRPASQSVVGGRPAVRFVSAGSTDPIPPIGRTKRTTARVPFARIVTPDHEFSAIASPVAPDKNANELEAEGMVPAQTGFARLPQPAFAAPQDANPQSSMSRVLGLRIRRIVIDAGHGGHDSGTLGPNGMEEKDVTLGVALRLGNLLRQKLGAEVIYTRRTDTFVPLEERTAIANRSHADLFLSIHANSSSDPEVRGVETYYLNFTASPDAMAVATRENATSGRSVSDLSDLVRKIALSDKIDESREFADDVQRSVYDDLAAGNSELKNRGVKQAPFVVLIGANMPSVLAEISFLTNPEDAYELGQPTYRERLAEDLYRGVAAYVQGMSGVGVAKATQPEPLNTPAE